MSKHFIITWFFMPRKLIMSSLLMSNEMFQVNMSDEAMSSLMVSIVRCRRNSSYSTNYLTAIIIIIIIHIVPLFIPCHLDHHQVINPTLHMNTTYKESKNGQSLFIFNNCTKRECQLRRGAGCLGQILFTPPGEDERLSQSSKIKE